MYIFHIVIKQGCICRGRGLPQPPYMTWLRPTPLMTSGNSRRWVDYYSDGCILDGCFTSLRLPNLTFSPKSWAASDHCPVTEIAYRCHEGPDSLCTSYCTLDVHGLGRVPEHTTKTYYFHCILISPFVNVEISLHFNFPFYQCFTTRPLMGKLNFNFCAYLISRNSRKFDTREICYTVYHVHADAP